MRRTICWLIVPALQTSAALALPPATPEQAVWSLEDSYWSYLRSNDLDDYRALWHPAFLGWPLANAEPIGKAQITDWYTARTGAGDTLESYALERLAARRMGDLVTVAYRVRMNWVTGSGEKKPGSLRIVHTWQRTSSGAWQIISGMAAPPDPQGH